MMISADKAEFKGLILADPPGFGKKLPALMAIAAAPGNGPAVIVTTSSCCQQWMDDIGVYFVKVKNKLNFGAPSAYQVRH